MVFDAEPKGEKLSSCARFVYGQSVQIPLGDSTYQHCTFVGTDAYGLSTVKTLGGRYKQVWDCNLKPNADLTGKQKPEKEVTNV